VSARPATRAIVDSNLVIRGLLRRRPRSVAVRLLDAAIDGRFHLVLSPYLLAEALAEVAQVVEGAYAVNLVARDPDDNPVVACALEAGARYVVTDDRKHLLPMKAVRVAGYRTVQIVSPVEFLRHHL
jgi:predicted nucleic acid-binding protein